MFDAEKRAYILPFLEELAYDFLVLGGNMLYQRPSLRRRILPPLLRPQHSAVRSQVQFPTKVQWFVTWLGASALSLLVLGVLLEMHC